MGRPKKCWSLKVGAHGGTVVVYERVPGGTLWLRWWVPKSATEPGRFEYRPLKHTDREAAENTARTVAAQLMASVVSSQTGRATVAEVLAAYRADVTDHLKGQGPAEAKRRIAIWTAFLGADRDLATIDFPTIDRYVRERRDGSIKVAPHKLKTDPSDGAIGADIIFLNAAINHGMKVIRSNGARLVALNPLRGYAIPKNKNVRRPVASYDRYLRVLEKADEADPQRLFGAFMMMLEGLGWRVSAVCGVRACDVDLKATPATPHGRIFKNPSVDKEGVGGWIPMSKSVRAGVDQALAVSPALGDSPMFPAPRARVVVEREAQTPAVTPMIQPSKEGPASDAKVEMPKAWTRYHARTLLRRAETLAGLDELEGGDFHPYRRAWASSRKHLSPQDVAAAGGWRDLRTLQNAYQQIDDATLLAVVSEPRKLREIKPNEEAAG